MADETHALKTQALVGQKAGVSQTTVSNLVRPDSEALEAPALDTVERVAHAFGLATWQLLLDRQAVGPGMADLLMRPAAPTEERRLVSLDEHRKTINR